MTENTSERRTDPPTRFLRLPEVMARTGRFEGDRAGERGEAAHRIREAGWRAAEARPVR